MSLATKSKKIAKKWFWVGISLLMLANMLTIILAVWKIIDLIRGIQ